jgi:hypothetical protein
MNRKPTVGDVVHVYGVVCRIVAVRPMYTIDVQEIGGDRCWRISGLTWRA